MSPDGTRVFVTGFSTGTGTGEDYATIRYILLADGPFAFLKGRDGEQYITATRRRGRWWITPNTTAHPRRGASPGD